MSVASTGGFVGADALLALATLQQSNWNDQMSTEMRLAQLQSDMASDLASIKSHLETANQNTARMPELQKELHAFIEKYGEIPELQEVTDAVREIGAAVDRKLPLTLNVSGESSAADPAGAQQYMTGRGDSNPLVVASGDANGTGSPPVERFEQRQIDNWLETLTDKLDACSTSDQLRMIHIKQLNDNINNNSGMVSGIIESRNNATSSIINNLA